MNETTFLYLFVGAIIILIIIMTVIIGWKFNLWRRQKFVKNLSEAEKKRWQRLEKYRVSKGGYKKGFVILFAAMIIPWILMLVFHISFKTTMLFGAVIFIPVLIPHLWFVFKRKNRDEIITVIFLFGIYMGVCVWYLGYEFVKYFLQITSYIFIFYWLLFKMKGEQEQMAIYCNLIVSAGLDMDSQLDGYSQRPFSKESAAIKEIFKAGENNLNLNFKKIADDFGKTTGKKMILMDWKINDNEAVFYPVTAYLLIVQIYLILPSLGKDKISWIKLNSGGRITVFVSKGDYDRILEKVTYHTLCQILIERFERAFIEFAKGNKDSRINAIKILKGE